MNSSVRLIYKRVSNSQSNDKSAICPSATPSSNRLTRSHFSTNLKHHTYSTRSTSRWHHTSRSKQRQNLLLSGLAKKNATCLNFKRLLAQNQRSSSSSKSPRPQIQRTALAPVANSSDALKHGKALWSPWSWFSSPWHAYSTIQPHKSLTRYQMMV